MKLKLHIVRKDLTRLRWPLAAWLATVAINLGIGFALIGGLGWDGQYSRDLELLTLALRVAGYLLTFVLTALLVQGDSLEGTTQFWVTRPISGGRLLAAKLCGWFLLLCLPQIAVTLPWWIACGLEARQIGLAALEVLAWQAAVALPAALVAVLTDTFGRFVLWSAVAVPLLVGAPPVGASSAVAKLSPFAPNVGVALAVYVLVLAGVVAGQFFLRDAKRALPWLALGMVLTPGLAALGGLVAGPANGAARQGTDWRAERVAEVKVAVEGAWTRTLSRVSGSGNRLSMILEVRGMPREMAIAPGDGLATRQTWRWPDGTALSRDGWGGGWSWSGDQAAVRATLDLGAEPPGDEETRRHQRKVWEERAKKSLAWAGSSRPVIGGEASAGARVRVEVYSEVPPATIERMRRTPPAYEATLPLRAVRLEKWLEVPLLAGGWQARNGVGFRFGEIRFNEPNAKRPRQKTEEGNPPAQVWAPVVATRTRYAWEAWRNSQGMGAKASGGEMVVLHRRTGEMQRVRLTGGPTLTIGSVEILCAQWTLPNPSVWRGERWVGVPRGEHWYAEASVALLGHREEARFTREVKAERFEIEP